MRDATHTQHSTPRHAGRTCWLVRAGHCHKVGWFLRGTPRLAASDNPHVIGKILPCGLVLSHNDHTTTVGMCRKIRSLERQKMGACKSPTPT